MRNRVTINFDRPNDPKIESMDESKTSPFKEMYEQAYKQIERICKETKSINEERNNNSSDDGYDFIYNIIPIIGERGSGKTSLMFSLRKHLNEHKRFLDNYSFITLKPIDAGHLEDGEDLFGIVLAKMFGYYNSETKHKPAYNRSEIFQLFSKIYTNFMNVSKAKDEYDNAGKGALTVLADMDASQSLRDSFNMLIRKFKNEIASIKNYEPENTYVVISIDDIDMNVSNTHKMLEQVQNYMMIPTVIILLTASYENLRSICKNYYLSFFKDSMMAISAGQIEDDSYLDGADLLKMNFIESCEELSHEYLNKLLPSRQIIRLGRHRQIDISCSDMKDLLNSEKCEVYPYTKVVMYKIAQGTGIKFYAEEDKPFFLEPESLRTKGQFINKIKGIEPIWMQDLDNLQEKESNIDLMMDNLFLIRDDIVVRHMASLSEEKIKFLRRIQKSDINDLNREIYLSLKKIYLYGSRGMRSITSAKFSDFVSYIYGVKDVYDEFYQYTETILSLYTIKLQIEKLERMEKYNESASKIEYGVIKKYIGDSIFKEMDNELVYDTMLTFKDDNKRDNTRDEDKQMLYRIQLGYRDAISMTVVKNTKIIKDNEINIDIANAYAMFLMFLSDHDYKLAVRKNNVEDIERRKTVVNNELLSLEISFDESVGFSLSSFFINACNPEILHNFYIKVIEAVESWNENNSNKIRIPKEIKLVKENYKRPKGTMKLIDWTKNPVRPISVLNLELLYNLVINAINNREKKAQTSTDAWETCCDYFTSIYNELKKIDDYYSGMMVKKVEGDTYIRVKSDGDTAERYKKYVPSRDASSYFYLNNSAKEMFNEIINKLEWRER